MEHQIEIQLKTLKRTTTSSKALEQDVSKNMRGGWKKITSMYKKLLFATNSEDRDTPANKISTQGIENFDTKTDTEAQSLLEIVLKLQGLYYASL